MQTIEEWAASVPPDTANAVAEWFASRLDQLGDLDDRQALIAEWVDTE